MPKKPRGPATPDRTPSREAHAVCVNCTDDLVVEIEFLDDEQNTFAHILLGPQMADMMLARMHYIRDQTMGLIPNTTVH